MHGLDALQIELPDDVAQKTHLLAHGVKQRGAQVGNENVQRQARKTAAGADIEQIGPRRNEAGRGERIEEMVRERWPPRP